MDQLRDKRVDTTKLRIKERPPLLELRKTPVPLVKEKLRSSFVSGWQLRRIPRSSTRIL